MSWTNTIWLCKYWHADWLRKKHPASNLPKFHHRRRRWQDHHHTVDGVPESGKTNFSKFSQGKTICRANVLRVVKLFVNFTRLVLWYENRQCAGILMSLQIVGKLCNVGFEKSTHVLSCCFLSELHFTSISKLYVQKIKKKLTGLIILKQLPNLAQ